MNTIANFFTSEGIPPSVEDIKNLFPEFSPCNLYDNRFTLTMPSISGRNIELSFAKRGKIIVTFYSGRNSERKIFTSFDEFKRARKSLVTFLIDGICQNHKL